jgi:hypothetical protein
VDRIDKKEPLEKNKKWNSESNLLLRNQTIFQISPEQK